MVVHYPAGKFLCIPNLAGQFLVRLRKLRKHSSNGTWDGCDGSVKFKPVCRVWVILSRKSVEKNRHLDDLDVKSVEFFLQKMTSSISVENYGRSVKKLSIGRNFFNNVKIV